MNSYSGHTLNNFMNKYSTRVKIKNHLMNRYLGILNDDVCWLTGLSERMVNRLAMRVEKPGAKQLWAMKPSLSSATHTASSPRFQSQLGMFRRYAYKDNNSYTV